jgi:O-succinylbenzoic acid--CoA ligase
MRNLEIDTITLNGNSFSKNNLEELKQITDLGDSWQHAIYNFLKNWFDDSETITVHTSGSTGQPKSIQLTKSAMRNSARMTNAFFGLNSSITALLCLPANYIAGKMMLVRAIEGKFNLLTVEPKGNPFENLQQAIDFTAITPFQLQYSLEEIKKLEIKKMIVGGAKINSETEADVQQFSTAIYETYGMTETCSHIALRAVNGQNKSDYFKVLNGVSIRTNENDCLFIKAPHLLEDEIVTNDIVGLIDNERFQLKGRFDNIINSGGVKLNPELIEQKLETLISVPYFISSKPDSALGNKVILVIQSSSFTPEKEAELMETIDATLEKYERPKEIIYIPQFCYSATNKLLKAETLRNLRFGL